MVFVCDILSYLYDHLCRIIFKPTMHAKVMGWTKIGFTIAYAQSLSVECDLDL